MTRLLGVVTAIVLAVGGLTVASVGPASAAPVWSVAASPLPPGPTFGAVADVSCPSATRCFAVGQIPNGVNPSVLIESWNGASWTVAPLLVNGTLTNIACSSATSCLAIGYAATFSQLLVVSWDGTTWSVESAPPQQPRGASDLRFTGLACTAATSCDAVGWFYPSPPVDSTPSSRPLIEHWDGSAWSIAPSPLPSGAIAGSLVGIACAGATNCVAVGAYWTSPTASASLIERWDGSVWTVEVGPSPGAGVKKASLSAVSCPSTTSCVAIGTWAGSDNRSHNYSAEWNGTSWSAVAMAAPAAGQRTSLSRVTCTSSAFCFAVGTTPPTDPLNYAPAPLLERWNGASWAIVAGPNLTRFYSSLASVACTSAAKCFAVGSASSYALTEVWNGTSWGLAGTPLATSQSTLSSVACGSATSCVAVGSVSTLAATSPPLAQRWNGSSWATIAPPTVPGMATSTLNDVACPSPTNCYAVGWSTAAGGRHDTMLIEHWDGTSWTRMTNPTMTGNPSTRLTSIACPAVTRCYAVVYDEGVVRLSGTTWKFLDTDTDPKYHIYSVACPSATSCFAVGETGDPTEDGHSHPLVEHVNGTTWSVMNVPSPSQQAAFHSRFADVTCRSLNLCFAVGNTDRAAGVHTFIERWNGTAWSIVTSPSRVGDNFLYDVSCGGPTSCVAVGTSGAANATSTLVETWNGASWAITPSPNRPGAPSTLDGVTCTAPTACFAVGHDASRTSTRALIERYG